MPNYKDVALVKKAYREILDIIKPGDVVNQVLQPKWYEFWLAAGFWGIRKYQKNLFGRDSDWRDVHSMLFLDEWATFSVELPVTTILPLHEYCLSEMSIHRLNLDALPEIGEINQNDIDTMMQAADEMMGTYYDIGQLLDIGLRGLLNFNQSRSLRVFDFGTNLKVCSVGLRICFEYLYQKKILPRLQNPPKGKWLFRELKPGKWPQAMYEDYDGTDVEATTPAHFANSGFFRDEFTLIARFKDGNRIL